MTLGGTGSKSIVFWFNEILGYLGERLFMGRHSTFSMSPVYGFHYRVSIAPNLNS